MIKNTVFLLVCIFALSVFSSCEKIECFEDFDEESIDPSSQLLNGVWDLNMISYREFDEGQAGNSVTEPFGPGTENGECTFEFTNEFECTMVDDENEESFRFSYLPKDRIRIGKDIYQVEVLNENALELVVFSCNGECSDDDELESGKEEHFYFSR